MSEAALAYAYDSVTRGLAHLHGMKQVHRDIKPHNLLINDRAQVKVIRNLHGNAYLTNSH
jgi:serine/threonine protein kinase